MKSSDRTHQLGWFIAARVLRPQKHTALNRHWAGRYPISAFGGEFNLATRMPASECGFNRSKDGIERFSDYVGLVSKATICVAPGEDW